MGKASSAKKVARAARAGGKKTGRRRQIGFPAALALIVVLGLSLVVFARESGQAAADTTNSPKRGEHWHAAYGVFICDRFVSNVSDKGPQDPLGIHTHDDGLIHIHPFLDTAAGKQARLDKFFKQTGLSVSDTAIKLPSAEPFGGRRYEEGETTCDGKPAKVTVHKWDSALAGAQGGEADEVFTEGLSKIRFTQDLSAFTFAFTAEGTDVPAPPGASEILTNAQNDQGGAGSQGIPPGIVPSVPDTGVQTVPDTSPEGTTPPTEGSAPATEGSTPATDSP